MKRWLLLLGLALLVLVVEKAEAEITSPYTVEERTQVNFGDATSVAGHYGLENYAHEYVGGYLHITFTTTHHTCCFSSYPPLLYITNIDPTTASSVMVLATNVIYQLLSGTHATDWYAYDIQFDATGYTATVTQAGATLIDSTHTNVSGMVDTDYAALANNYPIAPPSDFSMSFAPLLVHEVPPVSNSESVTAGHRSTGDRLRCVETTSGVYCPSEEVRQYYIKELMEMLLGLLQLLVEKLQNGVETAIALLGLGNIMR